MLLPDNEAPRKMSTGRRSHAKGDERWDYVLISWTINMPYLLTNGRKPACLKEIGRRYTLSNCTVSG